MLLGFVAINAVMMVALSTLLLRSRPTPVKQQAYESGVPALGDARERFSVRFYLVAILFIIFDIETVFMIPWAVYYKQLSCFVPLVNDVCPVGNISFFGLGEMLVFMAILLVGFIYVWKKGALQWD
jgi:NADH-quinone oxidoreductase subunit A